MADEDEHAAKRPKLEDPDNVKRDDAEDEDGDEAAEEFEGEEYEDGDEEAADDVEGEEGEEEYEDDEGEGEDDISDELERVLGELQHVQDELEKINDESSDKVLEVERQYNEVRRPVFARRGEVIAKVPDFWGTAFINHPFFRDILSEQDEEALTYLSKVDVRDNQDVKSGYTIKCWFRENPYFQNEVLSKEVKFADDGTLSAEGQGIKWKPDMDITDHATQERLGSTPSDSIFKWFEATEHFTSGAQDEVAINIKDDLWLNPLKYFHGEFEDEEAMEDPESGAYGSYDMNDEDDEEMDGEDEDEGEAYDDEEGDEGDEGEEGDEGAEDVEDEEED
mmetsp:Transcript_13608/g.26147  ORF Transcript_13608/g.26147 Transcript_13608/m.26147 type:complete len:336 (+) Transcript_13608:195-1202(+)|eukprot:CAMPEP_0114252080 /NCGR_PEP_ID=MMETSP0058-20121206/15640_1 /TAXON_ID=36894 /ORGANISM="Pyramimonas parkeae, CCMP726" /LENGTH=335 /DNA_ID=CAMNT_0001365979 /DNA_START=193 /DNA_END=1200 /DNA_ORIENTATION=+